jgi:hypothetical protein
LSTTARRKSGFTCKRSHGTSGTGRHRGVGSAGAAPDPPRIRKLGGTPGEIKNNFFNLCLLSEAQTKNALVNPPPQKKIERLQTYQRNSAYGILHFLHFYSTLYVHIYNYTIFKLHSTTEERLLLFLLFIFKKKLSNYFFGQPHLFRNNKASNAFSVSQFPATVLQFTQTDTFQYRGSKCYQ